MLAHDIEDAIATKPDFVRFETIGIQNESALLMRYSIDSMYELRNAKRRKRDFTPDDLRRRGNIDYARYEMPRELFDSIRRLIAIWGNADYTDVIYRFLTSYRDTVSIYLPYRPF